MMPNGSRRKKKAIDNVDQDRECLNNQTNNKYHTNLSLFLKAHERRIMMNRQDDDSTPYPTLQTRMNFEILTPPF